MAAKANRVRNLEGTAVRRGRGGKEKEWIDCVQNDVLAFDIASEWKATAVRKGVWFETVTETSVKRSHAGRLWLMTLSASLRTVIV